MSAPVAVEQSYSTWQRITTSEIVDEWFGGPEGERERVVTEWDKKCGRNTDDKGSGESAGEIKPLSRERRERRRVARVASSVLENRTLFWAKREEEAAGRVKGCSREREKSDWRFKAIRRMSRVSLNKSQYSQYGSRRVRKISSVRFVYGYDCVVLVGYMQKSLSHPSSCLSTLRLATTGTQRSRFPRRDSLIAGCIVTTWSRQRFKKEECAKRIRTSFENALSRGPFYVALLYIRTSILGTHFRSRKISW